MPINQNMIIIDRSIESLEQTIDDGDLIVVRYSSRPLLPRVNRTRNKFINAGTPTTPATLSGSVSPAPLTYEIPQVR